MDESRIRTIVTAQLLRTLLLLPLLGYSTAVSAGAPEWHYRIVAEYPHDPSAFTEGLTVMDGHLLESTGRYGSSMLVIRDLHSGAVLSSTKLDDSDFGEGTTVVGNRIVQLTWKSGVAYVYDRDLHRLDGFPIVGEGWGLTYNGHDLIESDGSPTLHFLDPSSFTETRHVEVRDAGKPVQQLNELEWAGDRIYANVWHDPRIAVIAPEDGHVIAWIDCGGLRRLLPPFYGNSDPESVLNGIAFDPATGHLLVTGKYWPRLFELDVGP